MRPNVKIEITAGTVAAMTTEQFEALRDNVCREGAWETADGLFVVGGDHLAVQPMLDGSRLIYIGIEQDGYTHS